MDSFPRNSLRNRLFRPFQTINNKRLDIGLFHCKLMVEARRGILEVNSEVGAKGEFRVILPIGN
jgi:signal transduction histidine kinase